jgi:hypothetical protein
LVVLPIGRAFSPQSFYWVRNPGLRPGLGYVAPLGLGFGAILYTVLAE